MRIAVLDIGGTAIKSGIWNGKTIEDLRECETLGSKGGAYLMESVKNILHTYEPFEAIGISTAGQVDPMQGNIHFANQNIPNYTGMQVKAILTEAFHVPVAVENDVNAAALGEMYFGAAKEYPDFLCLTYGTGVGGAVVIDRKLWRGSSFAGGSFGGILVHPEDGKPGEIFSGCYENYASTTALVRRMTAIDKDLDNGRKIFAAMEREEIKRAVDAWIDEIVYGLVTLLHCFNPTAVVLGGGIMAQNYIVEEIRKRIGGWLSPDVRNAVILQARLGNLAGLMGAAFLAEGR